MTIYRVKYYDQAGNGWTREITALDVRGAIKAALIDPDVFRVVSAVPYACHA